MRIWSVSARSWSISIELVDKIDCPVIDVSNKAVEETANIILNKLRKDAQE